MGKATIVSEQGAGEYTVEIQYEKQRIQNEIAKLQANINTMDTVTIPSLESEYNTALSDHQDNINALNAAINLNKDTTDFESAVLRSEKVLIGTHARLMAGKNKRLSMQKRLDFLAVNIPTNPTVTAWCADYSEGLSGDVGIMEIARIDNGDAITELATTGEPPEETIYLIQPDKRDGDTGRSAYNTARDGQLQPTLATTPEASFYNYMMLPGASKWRPRNRTGKVTAVDTVNEKVDVQLDLTVNTHQLLNVNQSITISSVALNYMGASVPSDYFFEGDHVVIEFSGTPTDWGIPECIGFVNGPRPTTDQPPYLHDGQRFRFQGTPPYQTIYHGTLIGDPPIFNNSEFIDPKDPPWSDTDASTVVNSVHDWGLCYLNQDPEDERLYVVSWKWWPTPLDDSRLLIGRQNQIIRITDSLSQVFDIPIRWPYGDRRAQTGLNYNAGPSGGARSLSSFPELSGYYLNTYLPAGSAYNPPSIHNWESAFLHNSVDDTQPAGKADSFFFEGANDITTVSWSLWFYEYL